MYYTYVLYSKAYDKIYVGFTSNIEQRLTSHNQLATKGWTIKFRPWCIIHLETFETKAEAMKREKELKSHKGRDLIHSIITQKLKN